MEFATSHFSYFYLNETFKYQVFFPPHASLQPIQCMNKFSNYIYKYTKAAHFDNWAVVQAITKYMYKVPYMINITIALRFGRAARVPLWTRSVPSCLPQLPPEEDYNANWDHWQSGDQPISEPEIGKERLTICNTLQPIGSIWCQNLVNIGSGNGLFPDNTKPLPKQILVYHLGDPVAFIWGLFHRKY